MFAATLLTNEKKYQKLLSWRKTRDCTLNFKIDLNRLFKKTKKRYKFDVKWKFLQKS